MVQAYMVSERLLRCKGAHKSAPSVRSMVKKEFPFYQSLICQLFCLSTMKSLFWPLLVGVVLNLL